MDLICGRGKSWPLSKVHHSSKVHIEDFSWHHPTTIGCELRFGAGTKLTLWEKIQTGRFQITLVLRILSVLLLHLNEQYFQTTQESYRQSKSAFSSSDVNVLVSVLSVLGIGIDIELLLDLFSDVVSGENDMNIEQQSSRVLLWTSTKISVI